MVALLVLAGVTAVSALSSGITGKYIRGAETASLGMNVAPLTPVADWLVQSDGTFRDTVSGTSATVTRAGNKTVYTGGRVVDVYPNRLAVRPRSDGKSGYEAIIEEARTNYLLQSSFETDSNSDGLADGWNQGGWQCYGTNVLSLPSDGVHQSKSQRWRYTASGTDAGYSEIVQTTAAGTFAAGDTANFSVYVKGSATGVFVNLYFYAQQADQSFITLSSVRITPTADWTRYSLSWVLPAGTSRVKAILNVDSIGPGDSFDLYFDAAQLEKGSFITSYIPTTATTITRNADVVTVPTTNWNAGVGTFMGVAGPTSVIRSGDPDWPYAWMFAWGSSLTDFIGFNLRGTPIMYLADSSNGTERASAINGTNGWHVLGMTYTNAGLIYSYLDGAPGGGQAFVSPAGLPTTANIGGWTVNGGHEYNGPIQRLVFYGRVLTPAEVLQTTNAIKDGPQ